MDPAKRCSWVSASSRPARQHSYNHQPRVTAMLPEALLTWLCSMLLDESLGQVQRQLGHQRWHEGPWSTQCKDGLLIVGWSMDIVGLVLDSAAFAGTVLCTKIDRLPAYQQPVFPYRRLLPEAKWMSTRRCSVPDMGARDAGYRAKMSNQPSCVNF
jgi:hypothetical protein